MFGTTKRLATVALAAAGVLAFGTAASGQQGGYGTPPPESQPSAKIEQDTLDRFISAYSEVETIRRNLGVQLSSAENEDEARAFQEEAQGQMIEAVQDAGLTPSEYNEIATQMSRDPELREKVVEGAAERR